MRWLRLLLLCVAPLCSSCDHKVVVENLSIGAEQPTQISPDEQLALPDQITLQADVENPGAKLTLKQGRVRIGYRGRRVVVLSLNEQVKVPARGEYSIEVPLRVSVARNSQSLPLREALRQHDLTDVEIDWEFKLRRGIVGKRIVQPSCKVSELLSIEEQQRLWQLLDVEANSDK